VKRRAAILSELKTWSAGRAEDSFILPIRLDTAQDISDVRTVVSQGTDSLTDNIDSIKSEDVTAEQLPCEAADVLALCILLQGSEFLREHGKDGTGCPKDDFKLLVNSYRLIKATKDVLVTQPELPHRLTLVRTLAELRSRLKPIINQRIKKSRKRAEQRIKLGPNGEDLMIGSATDSIDTTIDFSIDESIDMDLSVPVEEEGFSDELLTGGELPVPADRSPRPSAKKTTTIEPTYESPSIGGRATGFEASLSVYDLDAAVARRRRIVAMIVAGAFLAVALGIQVPRWFLSRPPAMSNYTEHLPVTGLVRKKGDDPSVVFMVDESWDDLTATAKNAGLEALYMEAHKREEVTRVVVRTTDGTDRAHIVDGTITILAP